MYRVVDFLRSKDLPFVARLAFRRERAYYLLWAILLGTVEGNLAGIVVTKTFKASELLTIIVCALPTVMMTLNLFWGIIIRGRDRKRLLHLITLAAVILVSSIGFNSTAWQPWNGWLFALQIALTHFFVSGVVTLRASMWKANYPVHCRGKIIGRLQNIHFLFVPSSSALAAYLFNLNPEYYAWLYPASAIIGLLALLPLRRFRVRRDGSPAEQYRTPATPTTPATPSRRSSLWSGLREATAILRDDRNFRRFMIAQFALGSANFYTDPVLLTVVTGRMGFDYLATSLIMTFIPSIMAWFAIPYWSRYFDRVGVLRFRVTNSIFWFSSFVGVTLALIVFQIRPQTLWPPVLILLAARVCMGIGNGGGIIAWSLGHMHFAPKNQVDLYMSIHVGLTGLRALTMPGLSLLLNTLIGNYSFLAAIGLSGFAMFVFRALAAEDQIPIRPEEAGARRTGPTTNANVT